jgi:hypothetical protein
VTQRSRNFARFEAGSLASYMTRIFSSAIALRLEMMLGTILSPSIRRSRDAFSSGLTRGKILWYISVTITSNDCGAGTCSLQ